MRVGLKWVGLVAAVLLLSACGGGGSGGSGGSNGDGENQDPVVETTDNNSDEGNQNPVVETAGSNQAQLGPLSGATINVYRITDLNTPVEGPVTAKSSDDLTIAGSFDLNLTGIIDSEWLLVTASGGQDIDANDDGVIDAKPTSNSGTIHALATAADIKSGIKLNVLSEMAWQTLKANIEQGYASTDDLKNDLGWVASNLLSEDITGDTAVDYKDLVAFTPSDSVHKAKLRFSYRTLLPSGTADDESLIGRIHNDTGTIPEAITMLFGDQLSPPKPLTLTAFTPKVMMPANRLNLTESNATVRSFVSETAEASESSTQVVMAEDEQNRTLMLGYAIGQDVLAETGIAAASDVAQIAATSGVEMSPKSTALALVMLRLSGLSEVEKTTMANMVLHDFDFTSLVDDINQSFQADPYFLEALMTNEWIVSKVRVISDRILDNYISSLNYDQNITASSVLQASASYAPAFHSVALQELHDDFWYTPITKWPRSPWYDHQPWFWYGSAGASIFKPPFIARSESSDGLIAVGNPTHVNYAMELYDEDGNFIDWYIVPRNSTLIQKAANSGAAYRDFWFINLHDDKKVAYAEMNKYLIGGEWNNRHYSLIALHSLHMVSSLVGVIGDATAIKKAGKLLQDKTLISTFTDTGEDLKAIMSIASTVDFSDTTSAGKFLSDNFSSLAETVFTGIIHKIAEDAAKDVSLMIGKMSVKLSNPAGWALLVFDAANDFVPFTASLVAAESMAGYKITHNTANITDVTRTDKRPDGTTDSGVTMPIAVFTADQGSGLTATFDASNSTYDETASPSYTWDFGDGTTASGESASHTYGAPGTYDITLTLNDGLGNTHEFNTQVGITNGSAPVINNLVCKYSTTLNQVVWFTVDAADADNDLGMVHMYHNSSDATPAKSIEFGGSEYFLHYPVADAFNTYNPKFELADAAGNKVSLSCTVHAPSGNVDTDYGLVGHYKFDGNAYDSSGTMNHGTENGGISYTTGIIGQAANFDGINDYIEVQQFKYKVGVDATAWTVSTWVKFAFDSNYRMIITDYDSTGGDSNFGINMQIRNTNSVKSTIRDTIAATEYGIYNIKASGYDWHLMTTVVDKPNEIMSFYLDGVLIGTDTISSTANYLDDGRTFIGSVFWLGSMAQFYKGLMDDLRIYNRALSEAEISQLYQMGQ